MGRRQKGEFREAKNLIKRIRNDMSIIPDKPLKMTLENGAVVPNFITVTDSAIPYINDIQEIEMLR